MTTATAPSPRKSLVPTRGAESAPSLVPAALFCAILGIGLATLAITPMLMAREYANALLLAPLALAAGTCFGGILSLVVFFDEKHA